MYNGNKWKLSDVVLAVELRGRRRVKEKLIQKGGGEGNLSKYIGPSPCNKYHVEYIAYR